ncbi:ABC transporter substrate-binding protein [Paenibacillus sp. FSL H8-0034]|uniref:ABC transporter substrate-binding protein n=1 Tax=Paenibacillus sp. FSL H8-0034 TaxID=2954671 RepID=UPI0030FA2D9E
MKKTDSRKMTVTFTVFLITVSLINACSSPGGNASTAQPAAEKEAEKKPAKLTYFMEMSDATAAVVKNQSETLAYQEMEKITGIKMEFQHPPKGQGQSVQALNLMIASNNLTDIIHTNWLSFNGGPEKAINDGVIIDLKDLIEKHAPNLSKILKENPDVRKQISTDTGKIYAFPDLTLKKEQLTYWGLGIRQDWLEKLGLQAPTTIDEWYTVMKAFKENDPNGNGKRDEIPMNINLNQIRTGNAEDTLVGAWGIGFDFYQEDGKVKYGMLDPKFKEFIATLQKWYKEGLLDQEYATTDTKLFDAKMTGDRIGSSVFLAGGGIGKYNQLMETKNPNFKLAGTAYPTLKKGDVPELGHKINYFTGVGDAVSKSNKNPIETVKWLDYKYGPEGHMLFNFGIEGKTYKMENGYPKYTDEVMKNPQGLPVSQALAKIYGFTAKVIDIRYNEQYSWITPLQKNAVKLWSEPLNKKKMPPVTPSPEESTKYASVMNDVKTYTDEMLNKFIMGAEPIENYDNFVNKLKSLHIDEAIKIQQTALDRYNKRP